MRLIETLSNDNDVPVIFLEFLNVQCPLVENQIKNQLVQQVNFPKKIHGVLDEILWIEWKEKPLEFVKPLSILLTTLFYDKVQLSLKKLENTSELDDLLSKISLLQNHQSKKQIDTKQSQKQFISYIKRIWFLANGSNPKTPVLDQDKFPLNKLLDFMFIDWKSCQNMINLVKNIEKEINNKSKLILPYIFEIGIPVQLKQLQGQVFTPAQIVDHICRQNVTDKTTTILDPSCGTGLLLLGSLNIISEFIHFDQHIKVIGIEKDPFLADIAESTVNFFLLLNPSSQINCQIFCTDFFDCDSSIFEFSEQDSKLITILMNPPYTRHEVLTTEYKRFLREKVGFDLQRSSYNGNKKQISFSGRSGLYVYFIIHATFFLKEGDDFGLIIPNSWLDVDYGFFLQQFLLNHYLIESIINCKSERLIPTVDVNTAIIKMRRKTTDRISNKNDNENLVKFVSIEKIEDLKFLSEKDNLQLRNNSSNIQIVSVEQKELYSKSKWGIFLRAPPSYFQFIERFSQKLVSLGDVARVRRGYTSGANDFFYVGKPGKSNTFFYSTWNNVTGDLYLSLKDDQVIENFKNQGFPINEPMFSIEKEYWMHRIDGTNKVFSWQFSLKDDNGETWVPNYLVKSPRVLDKYEIKEDDLEYVVILISEQSSFDGLHVGIKKYISWGEKWSPSTGNKFFQRPTCKSRKQWYILPSNEYELFPLLCLMTINDRYPFFYNPRGFYFDARLYGIQFHKTSSHNPNKFFAHYFLFLNSLLTTLQLELLGRSNLGEGALDVKVYEYELLKIPSCDFLKETPLNNIDYLFSQHLKESLYSIIQEIPKTKRKITDSFILDFFSLEPVFIENLFKELKNIVKLRIEKAR